MARTRGRRALLLRRWPASTTHDPAGRAAAAASRRRLHAVSQGRCAARASASACCGRRWASIPTSTPRWTRRSRRCKAHGAEVVDVKVADLQRVERHRNRSAAVRVQGRTERVPRSQRRAAARSLEALIAWNKAHAGGRCRSSGRSCSSGRRRRARSTDAAYLKARDEARRLAGKDGLAGRARPRQARRVIAPSMSPAWPTDHVLGDHFVGAGYGMAAVAGTPSMTVPMGEVSGLPLGLTFMGRAWSEASCSASGTRSSRPRTRASRRSYLPPPFP